MPGPRAFCAGRGDRGRGQSGFPDRRGSGTLPAGAAGLCPPGQPDSARRGSVPEAGFPGLWVRPSASQRADAAPPPGILRAFPLRDRPRTGKAGDNAGIAPRRPSRCGVLPFWVAAGAPTGYNRNETKKMSARAFWRGTGGGNLMEWADGRRRCRWANPKNQRYLDYHDHEWGQPVHEDQMCIRDRCWPFRRGRICC